MTTYSELRRQYLFPLREAGIMSLSKRNFTNSIKVPSSGAKQYKVPTTGWYPTSSDRTLMGLTDWRHLPSQRLVRSLPVLPLFLSNISSVGCVGRRRTRPIHWKCLSSRTLGIRSRLHSSRTLSFVFRSCQRVRVSQPW